MFTRTASNTIHEVINDSKQIKIPTDGQLSKKGTIIKNTKAEKEIDYSIAEIVEDLNDAGFVTKYSCSGIKKDHPLKDVKHDGGYISFLYQENEAEALAFIKKIALKLNLTVEHSKISQNPALIVRIDKDKAGNSLSDRITIANTGRNDASGKDGNGPYGAFTKDLDAIINKNGGLIYDSDDKIVAVWKRFCGMLLNSSCQNAS